MVSNFPSVFVNVYSAALSSFVSSVISYGCYFSDFLSYDP